MVAPGNPGCAAVAATRPVDLSDNGQIVALCKQEAIDLVVVGPEAPLVAGIADELEKEGDRLLRTLPRRGATRGFEGLRQGFLPRVRHSDRRHTAAFEARVTTQKPTFASAARRSS